MGDIDLALRHVSTRHPEDLARLREALQDVASAMHVVATAHNPASPLTAKIMTMLKDDELIKSTWLYQQGVGEGLEKGLEKGLEQGARAFQHTLLAVLASRKLRVTAAQKARIEAMHDLPTLERWTRNALAAKTTGALFDEPSAPKPSKRTRH